MAGYFGSDFDPSVPADTENASLGASRIRDIKQRIKTFFSGLFNLETAAWNTNVIPGSALTTISGVSGTYTNVTVTVSDQGLITSISEGSAGSYKTEGAVETYSTGGTGLSTAPANGQLLIGNGTGYTLATPTVPSGGGIIVTPGSGTLALSIDPAFQPAAPFFFEGTLTSAAAATPVLLVAALTSASPWYGRKLYITKFIARVDGATAWAGSVAVVRLADTNATPNAFVTIPVAALTADARVLESTSGVILEDAFSRGTGSVTNGGVQLYADAAASAGSNLIVQIVGFYV